MNVMLGTLMIFSSIFFLFFGVPIIMLGVTSLFLPPIGLAIPVPKLELPPDLPPIIVRKVAYKGNVIWIDA